MNLFVFCYKKIQLGKQFSGIENQVCHIYFGFGCMLNMPCQPSMLSELLSCLYKSFGLQTWTYNRIIRVNCKKRVSDSHQCNNFLGVTLVTFALALLRLNIVRVDCWLTGKILLMTCCGNHGLNQLLKMLKTLLEQKRCDYMCSYFLFS